MNTSNESSQEDVQKNMPKHKYRWLYRYLHILVGQENEKEDPDDLSPGDILRQMNGKWIQSQIGFVLLIFIFSLTNITFGYMTKELQIKRNNLKTEVDDYHFRSLTRSSQLTRETRQSIIEERLKANGDSTLTATPDLPLIVEREKQP